MTLRISPGEGGIPSKSLGKEGMPTITEQVEELNGGEVAREEPATPDKEKPQEPEEAWPIPVVEPQLGEQDLPKEEDGELLYKVKQIKKDDSIFFFILDSRKLSAPSGFVKLKMRFF